MVWKFRVGEYCDSCGLSNSNDKARFAVSLFEGKSLVWWMDWSRTTAGSIANLDYDDLMTELDHQFCDVDRERRL